MASGGQRYPSRRRKAPPAMAGTLNEEILKQKVQDHIEMISRNREKAKLLMENLGSKKIIAKCSSRVQNEIKEIYGLSSAVEQLYAMKQVKEFYSIIKNLRLAVEDLCDEIDVHLEERSGECNSVTVTDSLAGESLEQRLSTLKEDLATQDCQKNLLAPTEVIHRQYQSFVPPPPPPPSVLQFHVKPPDVREKREPEIQNPSHVESMSRDTAGQGDHGIQMLVSALNQLVGITTMPPVQLETFKGDRRKFLVFIANVESFIERRTADPQLRMQQLLQATTGQARKLIQNCVMLPPYEGYAVAKQRLIERYGEKTHIIREILDDLSRGPSISPYSKEDQLDFIASLVDLQELLRDSENSLDTNSPDRLRAIVRRFPNHWKSQLAKDIGQNMPTYDDIVRSAKSSAAQAKNPFFEDLWSVQNTNFRPRRERDERRIDMESFFGQEEDGSGEQCRICEQGFHPPWRCQLYRTMNVEDRLKATIKAKLCFNCFRHDHMADKCSRPKNCKREECEKRMAHNVLLHPLPRFEKREKKRREGNTNTGQIDSDSDSLSGSEVEEPNGARLFETAVVNNVRSKGQNPRSYLQVVPICIYNEKSCQDVTTYAMLDSGSDTHIVDRFVLNQLKLKGSRTELKLKSACSVQNLVTEAVSLVVRSHDGLGPAIHLPRVVAVKDAKFVDTALPTRAELACPELMDLKLYDISVDIPYVSLIIGTRAVECFVQEAIRKGNGLVCVKGPLGWSWLGGQTHDVASDAANTTLMTSLEDDLDFQLKTMFETERTDPVCGGDLGWSQNDRRAMGIMESTTKIIHDVDGPHYQVAVPWIDFPPKLENNRYIAEKCLESLKKRFLKDDIYKTMYETQMSDYEKKGYSIRLANTSSRDATGIHYVVHHGVKSEKKPGKVRVVFNCAKQFRGKSLNSCIHSGPDLARNLREVLIRWRTHEVVVTGDVQEMYHRVRTDARDHPFMRYLWWPQGDTSKEPCEYVMQVHLFGCISSSACANYALQRTGTDHSNDNDSTVVKIILNDFYVDDYAKSFPTEKEAIEDTLELVEVMKKGGFCLKKLVSNHQHVNDGIPADLKLLLPANENSEQQVLGVRWNLENDSIILSFKLTVRTLTKRGLLGTCMSIFDPLGLIALVTFQIRHIIQELCRRKLGWDDNLPDDILARVSKLFTSLHMIDGLEVPRCLKPKFCETISIQIHHFGDASMHGYASCSYLRCTTQYRTHVTLISAKSRVSPLKSLTIVRLEFLAARTMAREQYKIKKSLPISVSSEETFFWTDSEIVLKSINNDSRRFQLYAANILAEIHEVSTPSQWRHVRSVDNVADDATRLVDLSKLTPDSRWFRGPEFLYLPQNQWDHRLDLPDIDENERKDVLKNDVIRCTSTTRQSLKSTFTTSFVEHFSSLPKLVNAAAWLSRFVLLIPLSPSERKTFSEQLPSYITVREYRGALNKLVGLCQRDEFPLEWKEMIKNGKTETARTSSIRPLGIIQRNGLLCLRGRLGNSELQTYTKHPAILPQKHHITTLIIRDIHRNHGHQGLHYVISESRIHYWIIHANAAVKRELSRCIPCKRYNARPCEQRMADLPPDRTTQPPGPFERVGMDLFGPFYVRIGRRTEKRYAVLFTDLVYRGVHIDLVHSLSTDSFILALQRFIDRRGNVKLIRSDRGTNFSGGKRELREAMINWNQTKIANALKMKDVEWILNPGKASHWGGVWERIIKDARSILNHLLNKRTLDDETLTTAMTATEAILNNRPLHATSPDPNDFATITPNQLLHLKPVQTDIPGANVDSMRLSSDTNSVRRWKFIERFKLNFWKRFTREYLLTMQVRSKWMKIRDNVKVGDLVLLIDNNHRSCWKLGRILEVKRGRDSLVRSVSLKTSTSDRITRPITKICLLEGL